MQINASMLHELRMVILHVNKLIKRSGTPRGGGSGLLCVRCIRQKNFVIGKAVTITRGEAVCMNHIS